jgi:hypothetical protein
MPGPVWKLHAFGNESELVIRLKNNVEQPENVSGRIVDAQNAVLQRPTMLIMAFIDFDEPIITKVKRLGKLIAPLIKPSPPRTDEAFGRYKLI